MQFVSLMFTGYVVSDLPSLEYIKGWIYFISISLCYRAKSASFSVFTTAKGGGFERHNPHPASENNNKRNNRRTPISETC